MLKIVALTDLSKDESGDEEETITQVTKEAQVIDFCIIFISSSCSTFVWLIFAKETIAVSEYLRALSLKQNGNPDFALGLFEDLLKTQVLSDVRITVN